MRRLTLTRQIFIGLALGILVGWLTRQYWPGHAEVFRPFSQLFLRLVKMLLAPLLFSTLVAGVASAGHFKDVGRMGLRAIVYFEVVTTLALGIGLFAVNFTRPGVGLHLPPAPPDIKGRPQTFSEIFLHLVPDSIVKAFAENDVLQIVVFALLFAIAVGMLPADKKRPVIELCESISEAMFKLTHMVMRYAPIGVGAAMAYTVGHSGLAVLQNLGALVLTLYAALAVFLGGVLLPVALFFRVPLRRFYDAVKEPALIAFSTTTSDAAMPTAIENLQAMGIPKRIVTFILPLGYSFNLDGSTLYLSLASVFVAQAAGIELTLAQQLSLLLTLMLTSKGVAAVPRASLVVLAAALTQYNLPLEGITLILGVDELMDMARTGVNIIGNCLATVVVARWEGAFPEAQPSAPSPALSADSE